MHPWLSLILRARINIRSVSIPSTRPLASKESISILSILSPDNSKKVSLRRSRNIKSFSSGKETKLGLFRIWARLRYQAPCLSVSKAQPVWILSGFLLRKRKGRLSLSSDSWIKSEGRSQGLAGSKGWRYLKENCRIEICKRLAF